MRPRMVYRSLRPFVFALAMMASAAVASAQIQEVPPTISVTPSSAVAGEILTVNWTAPPGSATTDWIGLYHTSDPNTAYMSVTFTNGLEAGSFVCEAPAIPGSYEFRYLVNNSFVSVAKSNTILVEPASGFTLSLSQSVVAGNEEVTVEWLAPIGRPNTDWIGLFKHGEVDNHNYDPNRWAYTGGTTSGSHVFRMPTEPGDYVFRYLLRNSYASVSESSIIRVGEFALQASPSQVHRGEVVTLEFSAPVGQPPFDWIGLYEVGASDGQYITWWYTAGAPFGTISGPFDMPAGVYEFRYFVDNTFIGVATSNPVTVLEPSGFSLNVDKATAAVGEMVTVSWIAPNSRGMTDWIGLFIVGSENRQYLKYVYTGGEMNGSATFQMPFAGDFEFRYLLDDGYMDVVTSPTVVVR